MLKMFSTQLSGMFKRLYEQNEEKLEDSARLLAQSIIGEGKIYIFTTDEMAGVQHEAINGLEPLFNLEGWNNQDITSVTMSDRFLLISRSSSDEKILHLAKQLEKAQIPFIVISSIMEAEESTIQDIADVFIDLKLKKPLLPDDEGNRYGYPSLIAALYIYHGMKFTVDEIVKEYDI
ncbi:DUF2529 family protein [Bacillus sp. B1-b2]|uniref:DUF2529 family protein n=1 Tax=Bacillus sp. B1-b2 TaxID=2653201 RepID=UPI001261E9AA|nr:DUF2529 family protein [Bacillus sp. B1-b2]KAB7671861.1 DUF2529 domain-containing protein [Bacillus sp. B1-b2]